MLIIEYPSTGATYNRPEYGVYEYDVYPESSVLAGQERRRFRDSFPTLAEAREQFPDAHWSGDGSGFREVPVSETPPPWFDSADAGESWDGETYTFRDTE